MINCVILEGKIKSIQALKETEKGVKHTSLVLSVQRAFRNSEGNFDEDEIMVDLWRGSAELCANQCKEESLLSVQGRLAATQLTSTEGKPFTAYNIIAEKVSILN